MVIKMLHLILFGIYIAMILMVIFVERKHPTGALLWVVIMICLPYIGTVLYLIFGSTTAIRLTAAFRKKKLKEQPYNIDALAAVAIDESTLSESDLEVVRFNTIYNASELTCYSKADLYTDGESHYTQLFYDIKNAQKSVFIEFYTIHHDIVGEKLVEYLTKRRRKVWKYG